MNKGVVKSILGVSAFKLLSALISFISVPLLLHALGKNSYAVWVTSTGFLAWISMFDFGLGYSLKNRVTEFTATGKLDELQIKIAGTIQFYLVVTLVVILIFTGLLFTVDFFRDNRLLTCLLYIPVITCFSFTTGTFVLEGLRKFNQLNLLLFAQNIAWLTIVLLMRYKVLTLDVYVMGGVYALIYCVTIAAIFRRAIKGIGFSLKHVANWSALRKSRRELVSGFKFFFLQLSSLLIFSLGNFLVYNHLPKQSVAEYDTINKIYVMMMTFFNIAISIYWTEISHAKAVKNKAQLIKLNKQLTGIAAGFSILAIIASFCLPLLIKLWTNNMIVVSVNTLYPFIIATIIQAFAYRGAVFLNAFEKLNGQIIFALLAAALMVPVAVILFNKGWGIDAVPLSAALVLLPSLFYVNFLGAKYINKITA